MSLTSQLYRAARWSATGRAIRTGHIGTRLKNIIVGRLFARLGVFDRLYRPWR